MRVAPVGMIFASLAPGGLPEAMRHCFDLGCQSAAITHGHPTAQLSSGALAMMVTGLLAGLTLDSCVRTALAFLEEQPGHEETVGAITTARRLAAVQPRDLAAIRTMGEGWVAEEALGIGLYCAMCSPNFRSGVELAVNHGGDSDSTGSIAGQLLGAIHGISAIPRRWVKELELRDVIVAMADDLATVCEWHLIDDEAENEGDFYWDRYPGW